MDNDDSLFRSNQESTMKNDNVDSLYGSVQGDTTSDETVQDNEGGSSDSSG